MSALHWQTIGQGDCHLVLLHGWGLNAEVWHDIIERLSSHFTLHLVDLPGYGRSPECRASTLDEMVAALLPLAPQRAIWLGWSMGGLVASLLALRYPQRVAGVVTVSSSPRFSEGEDWPGIKPQVLNGFQHQLGEDFQRTVERFLALQTLGTASARQDARALKSVVLAQPEPSLAVLEAGLQILKTTDLRQDLVALKPPLLRLYGALDGLVPRRIAALLDALWPTSRSQIIEQAGHAPFLSHSDEFCRQLVDFKSECAICYN